MVLNFDKVVIMIVESTRFLKTGAWLILIYHSYFFSEINLPGGTENHQSRYLAPGLRI
jgi:hypothetical protein